MTTTNPAKCALQISPRLNLFNANEQLHSRWLVIKDNYHPNAYLQSVRNMKSGLTSRTRILRVLEKRVSNANAIAIDTGQSYEATFHHLRLLEAEDTVKRMGKKPYAWTITGLGQKQLS